MTGLFRGEKNGKKFGTKLNFVVKNVKETKIGNILKNEEQNLNQIDYNAIIEMAWCDKTSFESIKEQTDLLEKEVIKIMRTKLKNSSFKVWRTRVYGRKAKHSKI